MISFMCRHEFKNSWISYCSCLHLASGQVRVGGQNLLIFTLDKFMASRLPYHHKQRYRIVHSRIGIDMRITLTIPTTATQAPPTSKSDPPLVQLAGTGERMLIELQGELGYEGDPCGRVVGLLSFEKMVSAVPLPLDGTVLPRYCGSAGKGNTS
jgi:hypothetical protein